jgi:hypothetical protein
MNWIERYRLNPNWFFPENESEKEKMNREEIYELIRNHDRLVDTLSENRDAKISHIVEENYQDPLIYLNQYLDILFSKIDMVMESPQVMIYYIEDQLPEQLGDGSLNQIGKVQSKSIACGSIEFKSLEDLIDWIDKIRANNELFVYNINQPFNNIHSLRVATFPKVQGRIAGRRSKSRKNI